MPFPEDGTKRGIHVCRDTMVTVEDDNGPPDYRKLLPSTTISSRPPQRGRPKSTLRHTAMAANERDSTKELADFIRNTTPPPSNYMSAQSSLGERHEKTRRLPLWPFRKKSKKGDKKPNAAPELIKLPDSAVAAMTIGGHRHISISIPIEYAHLQAATRKAPVSSAELPDESTRRKEQTETPRFTPAGDDSLPLPCHSNNSAGKGKQRGEAEPSPESRTADPALSLRPAMAPFQNCPADNTVVPTNTPPNRRQRLRHEPIMRHPSTGTESLPQTSTRGLTDPDTLRKRPSTPESYCTNISELIYSDAATVRIPTPQLAADFRNGPRALDSDTGTASFHTPELDYSPLTISSRDTMNAGDRNREDLPVLNFSAPYSRSISQRPSMDELTTPHCTLHAQDYRRHTLSALASLESPFGGTETPQTLHINPFSVMAGAQPPSLGQTAFQHNGTITPEFSTARNRLSYRPPTGGKGHTQRTSGIPNIRNETPPPAPCFLASNPSLARPTLNRRASTPDTNPYSNPSPRPVARSSASIHRELINRYEDLRQTRDRELIALAERLERLEHVNERLLSTLVPLFERIADRLVSSSPSPSSNARRRYSYHSYPSQSDVSARERRRRSAKMPERLESVDSSDFDGLGLDRGRVQHPRRRGRSGNSGRARQGIHGMWEIGGDETEEEGDINNVSWLRSDSGLDSRETLGLDRARRGLRLSDELFPESVADDGSWRRGLTERQQPQDVLGNRAGLSSLESVMREVIRDAPP